MTPATTKSAIDKIVSDEKGTVKLTDGQLVRMSARGYLTPVAVTNQWLKGYIGSSTLEYDLGFEVGDYIIATPYQIIPVSSSDKRQTEYIYLVNKTTMDTKLVVTGTEHQSSEGRYLSAFKIPGRTDMFAYRNMTSSGDKMYLCKISNGSISNVYSNVSFSGAGTYCIGKNYLITLSNKGVVTAFSFLTGKVATHQLTTTSITTNMYPYISNNDVLYVFQKSNANCFMLNLATGAASQKTSNLDYMNNAHYSMDYQAMAYDPEFDVAIVAASSTVNNNTKIYLVKDGASISYKTISQSVATYGFSEVSLSSHQILFSNLIISYTATLISTRTMSITVSIIVGEYGYAQPFVNDAGSFVIYDKNFQTCRFMLSPTIKNSSGSTSDGLLFRLSDGGLISQYVTNYGPTSSSSETRYSFLIRYSPNGRYITTN